MKKEEQGNMITEWLEKYGNPEIMRQVEREAEELEIEIEAQKLYPFEDGFQVMDIDISEMLQLAFINGAKWQKNRMYSEEDMLRFAQIYAVNKLDKTHVEKYKKQTK